MPSSSIPRENNANFHWVSSPRIQSLPNPESLPMPFYIAMPSVFNHPDSLPNPRFGRVKRNWVQVCLAILVTMDKFFRDWTQLSLKKVDNILIKSATCSEGLAHSRSSLNFSFSSSIPPVLPSFYMDPTSLPTCSLLLG